MTLWEPLWMQFLVIRVSHDMTHRTVIIILTGGGSLRHLHPFPASYSDAFLIPSRSHISMGSPRLCSVCVLPTLCVKTRSVMTDGPRATDS